MLMTPLRYRLLAASTLALLAGCGSQSPGGPLDATGEQQLRDEMRRVEAAEQEHFRQSAGTAPANQPYDGANAGERAF